MNLRFILKNLGLILLCEGALMAPSLGIALYLSESDAPAFFLTMVITLAVGFMLSHVRCTNTRLSGREGFATASLAWLLVATFGALPFLFSGTLTTFSDAFFEAMSGFTTTGATVLADLESLPHGLLFWRSFAHWLGGMGIIVMTLAVLPAFRTGGLLLFRAEVPGPTKNKIAPRVEETAKYLYFIYIGISVVEILLLKLAGMPTFDAFIHTFGTMGTGGCSNKNLSVAAYANPWIEAIIVVFMLIAGTNYNLHFAALRGNLRSVLKDDEFRLYLGIIGTAIILITINQILASGYGIIGSLRKAVFQVVSIITTTGYTTVDFSQWPTFSRTILLALMFIGGCATSTSGAIKVSRVLILVRSARREVYKLLHPRAVVPVRYSGVVVPESVISNVHGFFLLYVLIFLGGTLALTTMDLDLVTAFSAAAATLGNIGPGLSAVGPATNYSFIAPAGKYLLSFLMLLGRLEIFSVLTVLSPHFWRD
ncbi:MAG: TrkH family potassium uptake protein [bacterium]